MESLAWERLDLMCLSRDFRTVDKTGLQGKNHRRIYEFYVDVPIVNNFTNELLKYYFGFWGVWGLFCFVL